MNRYHKEVFTRPEDLKRLEALTDRLNGLKWRYSGHCLDNLKHRAIDLESVLMFIRDLKLDPEAIFEYYLTDRGEPEKVCFRVGYNPGQAQHPAKHSTAPGLDLILVISEDKEIITIYINSAEDKHETLKKELYING